MVYRKKTLFNVILLYVLKTYAYLPSDCEVIKEIKLLYLKKD